MATGGAQTTAVSVRGLRKTYGSVEAVAGVDLEIRSGEVFALLGPNGAGKTTVVEILEGFRRRSGGEVSVLGVTLGGLTFMALGFAVGSLVRRAETAPVVANLTLFPILFISGVFYPVQGDPDWLRRIADVFPLSHLVHAFEACFSPYTTGSGFIGRDLLSLLGWGALGAFVAVRRFATAEEDGETRAVPVRRRLLPARRARP